MRLISSWACNNEWWKKPFAVSVISWFGGPVCSKCLAFVVAAWPRCIRVAVAVCSRTMEDSSIVHFDSGDRDVGKDGVLRTDMQHVYVSQFQPDVLGVIQRCHVNFCIQRYSVHHGRIWRLAGRLMSWKVSYNCRLLLHLCCWIYILAFFLPISRC